MRTGRALAVFAFLFLLFPFAATCAGRRTEQTIEFWGLGREGEVVVELAQQFERETGIRVDIQQIPWTAAHEKILTAHVGDSLPDVVQVGNSWMSELVTVDAIVPLEETLVPRADYFPGIWDTNVVDGTLYGIPWYVDTRVLFYRTDMIPTPPRTWSEWTAIMERLRTQTKGPHFYALVMPTNEWPQPVVLALQRGASLIDERGHALFDEPAFLEGFSFYVDLFKRGFAPTVSNSQVANLYQQFGEGQFAMFISGPWDIGNLRTRLTKEQQETWSTAPLPAPDGTPYPGVSLSGGSSLVVSKQSRKKEAGKKFIAFLSRPEIQARFFALSGDLPARRSAWNAPGLIDDREIAAFRTQLDRTVALPRVPEAENIVNAIAEHGQLAIRGQYTAREAAMALDRKIEGMLEKRRWVLSREGSSVPSGSSLPSLPDEKRVIPKRSEGPGRAGDAVTLALSTAFPPSSAFGTFSPREAGGRRVSMGKSGAISMGKPFSISKLKPFAIESDCSRRVDGSNRVPSPLRRGEKVPKADEGFPDGRIANALFTQALILPLGLPSPSGMTVEVHR